MKYLINYGEIIMINLKFEDVIIMIYCEDDCLLTFISNYFTPFFDNAKNESPSIIVEISRKKIVDNAVWIEYCHKDLAFYFEVMRKIRNLFLERIVEKNKFLFFHASSYVENGRANIILGKKLQGKTSCLISALLTEGRDFLSNDIVILNTETHICYGFPKASSIRYDVYLKYPILNEKFTDSIDNYIEYPFSKYSMQNFIDGGLEGSDKIRLSPQNFVKLFNKCIVKSARLGCFVIPFYFHDKSVKVTKLSQNNIQTIVEDNFNDIHNLLNIDSIIQKDLFNRMYQGNKISLAFYKVKINEINYKFIFDRLSVLCGLGEMNKKLKLYDIKMISNNYNSTYISFSAYFKKKVFIKVFEEEKKFRTELSVVRLFENSGYLLHNEKLKLIVYEYRNYVDIEKIDNDNLDEICKTIANYHDQTIEFAEHDKEYVTQKIKRSLDELFFLDTPYATIFKFIFDKISIYFDIINEEEDLLGTVTIHGDFGLRNLKIYNGKIQLIDFERSKKSCFWLDFVKFFNRELIEVSDRIKFIEIYKKHRKTKFIEPSTLYCMAQQFYSALGILKYCQKFSDPIFLCMGEKILEKVSNYFSDT